MGGQFVVVPDNRREMLDYLLSLSGEKRAQEALGMEKQKLAATLPLLGAQAEAQQIANQQAPERFQLEKDQFALDKLKASSYIPYVDAQTRQMLTETDWRKMELDIAQTLKNDTTKAKRYGLTRQMVEDQAMADVWRNMTPDERKQTVTAASDQKLFMQQLYALREQLNLAQMQMQMSKYANEEYTDQLIRIMDGATPMDWVQVNQARREGQPPQEVMALGGKLTMQSRIEALARSASKQPDPETLKSVAKFATKEGERAYTSAFANMKSTGVFPPEVRQLKPSAPGLFTYMPSGWYTREDAEAYGIADEWDNAVVSSRKLDASGKAVQPSKLVEDEVRQQMLQKTVDEQRKELDEIKRQLQKSFGGSVRVLEPGSTTINSPSSRGNK